MEDSILEGLEKLAKVPNSKEIQTQLLNAIKKFNVLSFQFQEEWNSEMWENYNDARKPNKVNYELNHSPGQISKKLQNLQEIAITLSRMSRESQKKQETRYFAVIDKEALEHSEPLIKKKDIARDCSFCYIL